MSVKFWLQIGKEEQLRRFEERQKVAYKRYKITDEDWRNREKWEAYDVAINEMVERMIMSVGRSAATVWTLVEANSKYRASVQCIATVCKRVEEGLS